MILPDAMLTDRKRRWNARNSIATQVYKSMTDILEHRADLITTLGCLLSEQKILDLAQWTRRAIVDEVIPCTRISIKHGRRLDDLPAVLLPTALALECVVRVARSVVSVLKQFAQRVEREVALDVFCGVDDTG